MGNYCKSLTTYLRRTTCAVRVGCHTIGGDNPVVVQTMTNTRTLDTEGSVAQIDAIARAGGRIVRLTTRDEREAANLGPIGEAVRRLHPEVALVADVHFVPAVAAVAATTADKVRINPGNYNDRGGKFEELVELCRKRGVALRIGVNHGSLAKKIFDLWGDTPEGMAASAMEFLERARELDFHNVVVSLKASNVRVMIYAYRLLVKAMNEAGMEYPVHLGVTEAGNHLEGRIKSAVGIGALLADGIGDTVRVSLTEAPENEIPAAQMLADHFTGRPEESFPEVDASLFEPYRFTPRPAATTPLLWSEVARPEDVEVVEAVSHHPVQEWRSKLVGRTFNKPVVLHRRYTTANKELFAIQAAADFGVMFIDSLADGIRIENPHFSQAEIDEIALIILQAARVRISRTEYIACPSCGRTLYDIESTLAAIKARTNHLVGLKIGVMGCIVNGPGEMADADYGYVGGLPDHISLYRGRTLVERNVPQSEAIDRLVELIKADGRWVEPTEGQN
ncbi:MAG: (E)-4-hydroxy-3-methylbut-2-enyl-diphosphate synthase [Tidjanibacter sp.]|nr:(E)-4-hydroxy-3-methylbut-2-enyl-diphosphate synthase [Tidjanibacter sp.]